MSKFCDVMLRLPPPTFMNAGSSRTTVHLSRFSDVPLNSSSPGHVASATVASILIVAFWCRPPASVAVSFAV